MLDFVKKLFFYSSILVLNVQRFFFLILSLGAAVPSHHTACSTAGQAAWLPAPARMGARTGDLLLCSPFPPQHLVPPRKSDFSGMCSSTVDWLQLAFWEQTPSLAATYCRVSLFFSGGLWSWLIISHCIWLMELLSMTPARSLKANLANLPLAVYVLGWKCASSESTAE